MSNVMELSSDGCLRFVLSLILDACEASDKDFLASDRCIKLLDYIPTNMLQNALDRDVISVGGRELSRQLIKKVDRGDFKIKKRVFVDKSKKKTWLITHPCGFEEEVDNIKEFAEDVGLLPSGFLSVANNAMRQSYRGYKVVRLV